MDDSYNELARRHGYADSERYRAVLEYLMTPLQAEIANALPASPEELTHKLNMNRDEVILELDSMFHQGLVFPKNYQTLEGCRFARSALQLQDATQSDLTTDPEQYRRLFELWEDFNDNEFYYHHQLAMWRKQEQPLARIIPAYKAVKDHPGLLPDEDVRELLAKVRTIAVVACTCRKRKYATGKPCGRSHYRNCFQLNRGAEYAIARGSGTKLSYQDAMEIIDEVENDGLVHTWFNVAGHDAYDLSTVMCNCCPDCCINLLPMKRFGVEPSIVYAKSRYEARVDPDICIGCKICTDRCPYEAINMVKEGAKKLKAMVNPEKCMGCGICVITCKSQALSMHLVRPPEHFPKLLRT